MKGEPAIKKEAIQIRPYDAGDQAFFEQLYRGWFRDYFHIEPEPIDEYVLTQPQQSILEHGGCILIALYAGRKAGTVALKNSGQQTFELTKMGVGKEFRGRGLGRALGEAAIKKARMLGARKIVLYTHSSLETALDLYKKLGFSQTLLEPGIYSHARCDLKMELTLDQIVVCKADSSQAPVISAIGRESFAEAFGPFFNLREDLERYLDYTYDVEKINRSLANPNNIFYLARSGQVTFGFAKIKKQSCRAALLSGRQTELQKIYVLKPYQGWGAGKALLQTILGEIPDWKADLLWLDVLKGNLKAIQFYENNGFEKREDHFFKIGSQTFAYDLMDRKMIYP
jgi:ribosomal protein S18 acetylase RimI-like enzyme